MVDLTQVPVISSEAEQSLDERYDILEDLLQDIENGGVSNIPRPRIQAPDPSEIGEDASSLTEEQLSNYLAKYTAWASFYSDRAAVYAGAHKLAESHRKAVYATLFSECSSSGIAKADIPHVIKNNPLFLEIEMTELKYYVMKKVVEGRYNAMSKATDMVSRLITILIEDKSRSANSRRVSSTGKPVYGGGRRSKKAAK